MRRPTTMAFDPGGPAPLSCTHVNSLVIAPMSAALTLTHHFWLLQHASGSKPTSANPQGAALRPGIHSATSCSVNATELRRTAQEASQRAHVCALLCLGSRQPPEPTGVIQGQELAPMPVENDASVIA
jgi:hypothetical protein